MTQPTHIDDMCPYPPRFRAIYNYDYIGQCPNIVVRALYYVFLLCLDFSDVRARGCHSFDWIWSFDGQLEAIVRRYTPAVCGCLATGIRELSGFPAVSAG